MVVQRWAGDFSTLSSAEDGQGEPLGTLPLVPFAVRAPRGLYCDSGRGVLPPALSVCPRPPGGACDEPEGGGGQYALLATEIRPKKGNGSKPRRCWVDFSGSDSCNLKLGVSRPQNNQFFDVDSISK